MSLTAAKFDNEFCPSCGNEAPINGVSGFCIPCTKERYPGKAVCNFCGKVEERGQFRTICQTCQWEEWLAQYADKIEAYMIVGLTFRMAIVKIQFDNRPICLSCGNKIKGGTKGRHFFCRTLKECKSAGIKFKHMKEKGKSKEEALIETVRWINERRSKQVIAERNS